MDTSKYTLIAKVLLWVAALAALMAGITAAIVVTEATQETKIVETWRMIGLLTFSGFFAVLALKPQENSKLWALVLFNKLALTTAGLLYLGQNIPGAVEIVTWDGVLSIVLIAAFILSRKKS